MKCTLKLCLSFSDLPVGRKETAARTRVSLQSIYGGGYLMRGILVRDAGCLKQYFFLRQFRPLYRRCIRKKGHFGP